MSEPNGTPLWREGPIPTERRRVRVSDYLVGRKLIQFRDELGREIARRRTNADERGADALNEVLRQLCDALERDRPASPGGDDRMARRAADWLARVEQRIAQLRQSNNEAQAGALVRARDRIKELIWRDPAPLEAAPHVERQGAAAFERALAPSAPPPSAASATPDAMITVSPIVMPAAPTAGESDGNTGSFVKESSARKIREDDRQLRGPIGPLIERAVEQAGSDKFPAVYAKLREMGLNSEAPFTGEIKNDGGLIYTDDTNVLRTFTKDALSSRLRRRRNPS